MFDAAVFLLLLMIALLWLEQRKVQEVAVARCRRACEDAGVQFLDDIAPVWRVSLMRDTDGIMRLRRVFTFDYYTTTGERRYGSIVMLGRRAVAVHLDDRDVIASHRSDRVQ
jgi:hypothetical protein